MARSRAVRRFALAGLLAVSGLLVSGCSFADWPRFGWPEGITPQAERMQYFWSAAFIAALLVGGVVWGLMFWAFFVYRKKKNGPLYPKQTKENLPLELVYTAVPFLMVGVLFYFTVTTEDFALEEQPNPEVTVNVTAFKWNWDFGYPGTSAPDGGEVHTVGNSEEVPILVLPANKLIQYELPSKDVIHSFWTHRLPVQARRLPEPEANQTDNIFQNTIQETGAFVGRCAELCGTYHSQMNFEVRVRAARASTTPTWTTVSRSTRRPAPATRPRRRSPRRARTIRAAARCARRRRRRRIRSTPTVRRRRRRNRRRERDRDGDPDRTPTRTSSRSRPAAACASRRGSSSG